MQGCKLWRSQVIRGIDNIGICTTDVARSVAFYQKLGLSEAYRNDRGVMMAAGDAHLFIFATRQVDPPPVTRELGLFGNPPGIDHISFAVADVDALYSTLQAAGVACGGPPEDQPWGARMVGLNDPDGNNLYLLQRL
jgi:catechol 2,3-dioxygenase-like lactoylglutathione lyase family enzyme